MSIGMNIRRLREERKMTQEQLAEKLDVSFQAVSSWERDAYKPETDHLLRLAEIFDVSVSAVAEDNKRVFKTKEGLPEFAQRHAHHSSVFLDDSDVLC